TRARTRVPRAGSVGPGFARPRPPPTSTDLHEGLADRRGPRRLFSSRRARDASQRGAMELSTEERFVRTDDGWKLALARHSLPSALDRARRPLLIVPGYGMNGFIF